MAPPIEIENVVASMSLDQNLDLDTIAKTFPLVDYKPENFPGIIYHTKKPRAASLIFRSGKVVCSGMKSERLAKKAASRVISDLKDNGIVIIGEPDFSIENMVASMDLGGQILLEDVAYELDRTVYDPAQFPGVIYRMEDPKVTFLIFSNGKIVCTGARRKSDVIEAASRLQGMLEAKGLINYH